jgi:Tol biopolymer transport system component
MQAATMYPLTSAGVSSATITLDGQSVAFIGAAVGISGAQLYVWNSQLKALTYTNSATSLDSFLAISPDGKKLAYLTGSPASLFVADLAAKTVSAPISSGTFQSHLGLHFSNDGRFLTYAITTNFPANQNVYLYDFQAGTSVLISQNFNSTGITNANSDSPAISPDGRFIAYRNFAMNLVPFDFNNTADLFIFDTSNNATILASVNVASTASADDRSLKPVFSPDGRTLFFESWAADIFGNDFNNDSDLFALDLTALPLTILNGGGATNAESGFVAQLVLSAAGSTPAISWPLATGKSYLVQYKTNLSDAVWLNLPGSPTFIGDVGYLNDSLPSPGQRFYRIVLTP